MILRCHRCRAYAHPRHLDWIAPRHYECKDARRCLRGVSIHLFLSRLERGQKNRERYEKIAPAWLSEPPEHPDPGDWRLPDPRADEEALRYRERLRASSEGVSWERDG